VSILPKLASSQNRKDEIPNQELAQEIAETENKEAVAELVSNLSNKDKNLQSDCIKVLYEIGERKPGLISEHLYTFLNLLQSKNNRLVWGAMTALNGITSVNPKAIYENLPEILAAANKGSVIAKDQSVNILIKLAAIPEFTDNALILLLELMQNCPTNQLPMYAENTLPVITENWRKEFAALLTKRMPEIDKESKQKRVAKVVKKLS
jgi:hypothetical protein